MRRFAVFTGLAVLFSCTSQKVEKPLPAQDWCPQGLQVGAYARIEGIVDYEDINWCKMVVRGQDATLEVYYTQDGMRQRVVQYAGGVKRTEVEIRKSKAVMRIYDSKGALVEEIKGREEF